MQTFTAIFDEGQRVRVKRTGVLATIDGVTIQKESDRQVPLVIYTVELDDPPTVFPQAEFEESRLEAIEPAEQPQ